MSRWKSPFVVPLVLVLVVFTLALFARRIEPRAVSKGPSSPDLIRSSAEQRLQKFRLKGFDERGKLFWHLEGDTAKIDSSKTVYLQDQVTLRLRDNMVVRTDHVQWSQAEGVMRTDAMVYADQASMKVTGRGAVGRPAENFLQLNRDVEMIINDTTKIRCLGPMKIFYEQDKMVFYRQVQVTDPKGSLKARRMDVFFDPAKKKIDHIVAVGDVLIERGEDQTRSQRAVYSVETGSVRLEGNPEVTLHKDSNLLHGAS